MDMTSLDDMRSFRGNCFNTQRGNRKPDPQGFVRS